MKHLKMLSLVAAVAMAVTMSLAAASASATVLCKTASNPCPSESRYASGTVLDASLASGTSLTFENPSQPVDTCTGSTLKAKSTGTGGSGQSVPFAVEELTFSACTSTALLTVRGEMQLHWISGSSNGILTARGTAGSAAGCSWSLNEWTTIGVVKGGNPATIEINMPITQLCLWTRMTANYTVTTPKPLYVEES